MLAPLEEILKYKHPAVVRRFKKDHPAKADQAQELFDDLLRFFWASKKHSIDKKTQASKTLDFVFIMDEEMRDIDQMWHVFLLYTQDYTDFCLRYFDEFLHHLPDIVPTFETEKLQFEPNLEKFLDYTYDLLGENLVRRWFAVSSQTQN